MSTVTLVIKNDQGDNVNNSPIAIPPNQERRFSAVVPLLEGGNNISVLVADFSGNLHQQSFRVTYIIPMEIKIVDCAGGTVGSPDGATVIFPPDSLLDRTEISVNTVSTTRFPKPLGTHTKSG